MSPNYVQAEMPARYSQADAEWIQQQLQGLPPSLRRKVALKSRRYTKTLLMLSLFHSARKTEPGMKLMYGFAGSLKHTGVHYRGIRLNRPWQERNSVPEWCRS